MHRYVIAFTVTFCYTIEIMEQEITELLHEKQEERKLKQRVKKLRKQGLSLREIEKITGKNHIWVWRATKDLSVPIPS